MRTLVTEYIPTVSAVMLKVKKLMSQVHIEKDKMPPNHFEWSNHRLKDSYWSHTLRTKALKSVPQAVHFVTASSGT